MRQGFRRQDRAGSCKLCHAGDEEADGPAAEDGRGLPEPEMREVDGVDRHAERLADRAYSTCRVAWKGKNKMRRMGEVLTETPGSGRAAEEPEGAAQIGMTSHAIAASTTGHSWVHHHGRPEGQAICVRPESLDDTCHLVPEDVASGELQVADPAVGVVLQIGSANAHRLDPDQNFPRARRGKRNLFQVNLARRDDFGDSHG